MFFLKPIECIDLTLDESSSEDEEDEETTRVYEESDAILQDCGLHVPERRGRGRKLERKRESNKREEQREQSGMNWRSEMREQGNALEGGGLRSERSPESWSKSSRSKKSTSTPFNWSPPPVSPDFQRASRSPSPLFLNPHDFSPQASTFKRKAELETTETVGGTSTNSSSRLPQEIVVKRSRVEKLVQSSNPARVVVNSKPLQKQSSLAPPFPQVGPLPPSNQLPPNFSAYYGYKSSPPISTTGVVTREEVLAQLVAIHGSENLEWILRGGGRPSHR